MSNYTALAFPNVYPKSMTWGMMRFDSLTTSPISGSNTSILRGYRWKATLSWNKLNAASGQKLSAWLDQMSTIKYMTLIRDFTYQAQGTLGGTPLFYDLSTYSLWAASTSYAINHMYLDGNGNVQAVIAGGTTGASQPTWATAVGGTTTDGSVTWYNLGPWSAFTIPTYGWTANKTGVLLSGDMVQTDVPGLHRVTVDVDTNSEGQALIQVAQGQRKYATHGTALVLDIPSCYMIMNTQGWDGSKEAPRRTSLQQDFVEVIP